MQFTLGKSLRVLGVVEFVVFFASIVKDCCTGDITVEGDVGSALQACFYVQDAVNAIFILLELSIYISILVLLMGDLEVCQSPKVNIVIVLAFCCLALRIAVKLLSWWLSRLPEKEAQEKDVERVTDFAEGFFGTALGFFNKFNEVISDFRGKRIVLTLLATIFILFFLVSVAAQVFFFATSIKLAIPSEYEASCTDDSIMSLVVMFGLPSLLIMLYLVQAFFALTTHFSGKKISFTISFAVFYAMISLAVGVLKLILFARITKIWQGEELELYEYLGLAVSFPLVPII